MKKPFDSLRYRYIAIAASSIFILAGIVMFFAKGFVTGIDFGSGYSEEVRIAPHTMAIRMPYCQLNPGSLRLQCATRPVWR